MDAAIDHGAIDRDLSAEIARLNDELEACRQLLEEQTSHLEQVPFTDALTDTHNRRGFRHALSDTTGGAVLLVAIDHFKRVNERHGHAIGDEALLHVTRAIRQVTPENSTVARWGAGEFAIHLDTSDAETCASTAEAIRRIIASAPMRVVGDVVALTVSIGLALPSSNADLADLLRNAGDALHRARACGHDRIISSAHAAASPLRI